MFLYTREAHPGESVPHHDTFARKLEHARLLRDEIGISRPILVDDLDGTVHRAYGMLPNMTWVVDRGGRIVYRADWTSAANVEAFVERYRAAKADRSQGPVGMYASEQIEFRRQDRDAFRRQLERNGPRAVSEWDEAVRIWQERDSDQL